MNNIQKIGFGGQRITETELSQEETDLFTLPQYDTRFKKTVNLQFYATNIQDVNGPYRIEIVPNKIDYINVKDIKLCAEVQLVDSDGKPMPQNNHETGTVPNLLPSMIKTVQVAFNNKQIPELTDDNFAHKCYLEEFLNKSPESQDTQCVHNLMLPDTVEMSKKWVHADLTGKYPTNPLATNFDTEKKDWEEKLGTAMDKTENFYLRLKRFWDSKDATIDLVTNLNLDIFSLRDVMLPGVGITLTFHKNPREFYLMSKDTVAKYKNGNIVIKKLWLDVPFVSLSDEMVQQQTHKLERGDVFKGFFTKSQSLTYEFPAGSSALNWPSMVKGHLPRQVILVLIPTKAYNGSLDTTPYQFTHANMIHAKLRSGTEVFPQNGLTMDFTHPKFAMVYSHVLRNIGIDNKDASSFLTYENFAAGSTILCWDLTPDLCSGHHLHKNNEGVLSLEIQTSANTTEALTAFALCYSDRILTIDKNGNTQVFII